MNIADNIELAPHTLRRCFATYNAISGMPLPVLQKVLGHSRISTTALYIKDSDLTSQLGQLIPKLVRLLLAALPSIWSQTNHLVKLKPQKRQLWL
ncbi:8002_t:CDS:2 [Entrophospora sp. SA101]|nr:8002_t:CDS:2 [Entrophospora sp. SA101]